MGLESCRGLCYGAERGGMGENRVEVLNWVIINC